MKKVVYWSIGVLVSVLLLELLIFGSYGDKLNVQEIDVLRDTELEIETATCENHYEEVLSTEELYLDFVTDCKVTKDLNYDSDYFLHSVIIVSNYFGDERKRPKSFFDYYFSVNGKETIKVTYHNKMSSNSGNVWYWYLIEMDRDQIATEKLVIG